MQRVRDWSTTVRSEILAMTGCKVAGPKYSYGVGMFVRPPRSLLRPKQSLELCSDKGLDLQDCAMHSLQETSVKADYSSAIISHTATRRRNRRWTKRFVSDGNVLRCRDELFVARHRNSPLLWLLTPQSCWISLVLNSKSLKHLFKAACKVAPRDKKLILATEYSRSG